jgi:hypothetical protein
MVLLPNEKFLGWTYVSKWKEPLKSMAKRTDAHDLDFMALPTSRMDWEVLGGRESFETAITEARSLKEM